MSETQTTPFKPAVLTPVFATGTRDMPLGRFQDLKRKTKKQVMTDQETPSLKPVLYTLIMAVVAAVTVAVVSVASIEPVGATSSDKVAVFALD